MALVDSEAAFSQHCSSIGAPASVVNALKGANIITFAGLAFACGTPQNPPSDESFKEFCNNLFDVEPSIGEISILRRIQFEASTLMVAHVKSQVSQRIRCCQEDSGTREAATLARSEGEIGRIHHRGRNRTQLCSH